MTFVQKKKSWSSGLVIAFVSVDVWRNFIGCQIFRETGSVGNGRQSHKYVFQKLSKELGEKNDMIKMKLCMGKICRLKRPPTFGKEKEKYGVLYHKFI
jgi:hypothetical protein